MHRPGTALRAAAPILAVLLVMTFPPDSHPAPGAPDSSFNGTGFLLPAFGGAPNYANAVTAQFSDGKIVSAGAAFNGESYDFCIIRYNTDGSLDESFGSGGIVLTGFTAGSYDIARCVTIQGDGKIVVGGDMESRFAVVRYHPDGTLDTSFDGDGIAVAGEAGFCQGNGITLQPDGKIVLVGSRVVGDIHFTAVRFLGNGQLDVSFGGTGIITSPLLEWDVANGVALQPDLKIVATGTTRNEIGQYSIVVVRYNTDGSLDPTFHLDGSTITALQSHSDGYAVAIQSSLTDGTKIVVAGSLLTGSDHDMVVVRYNPDGTPDGTFSGDGVVTTDFGLGTDIARSVAVQYSGATPIRIVVAGSGTMFGDMDFAVARYLLNGTPDGTFNGSGRLLIPVGPPGDDGMAMTRIFGQIVVAGGTEYLQGDCAVVRVNDNGTLDTGFNGTGIRIDDAGSRGADAMEVTVQSDGRIAAAGYAFFPEPPDFAVFRCFPDGTPDSSFNGTGFVVTRIFDSDEKATAVDEAPGGKLVAAGTQSYAFGDSAIMVVRYNQDGSLDNSFAGDGILIHQPEGLNVQVEDMVVQPDGRILVAGWTLSTPLPFMTLNRYLTNGDPDPSFGIGGFVTIALGDGAFARSVALRPDGRILVAGYRRSGASEAVAVVSLNPDGYFDSSWGGSGWVITSVSGGRDQATDVAIEATGRVVVAGRRINTSYDEMILIRYNTDGTLDTSFDSDGIQLMLPSPTYRGAFTLGLQPNGRIVAAGQELTTTRFDFLLARLEWDGSLDASYGPGGLARFDLANGAHNIVRSLVVDGDGNALFAGNSGFLFTIGRIQGDGPQSGVLPEAPDAMAMPSVGLPWPNPARGGTALPLRLSSPASVSAAVVDVTGRKVRSLAGNERLETGEHQLRWDGRNEGGLSVAGGVYFLRVLIDGTASVRAVRVLGR